MKTFTLLLLSFLSLNLSAQDTIRIIKKDSMHIGTDNLYLKALQEHIKLHSNLYKEKEVVYVKKEGLIAYALPDSVMGKKIILLSKNDLIKTLKKLKQFNFVSFEGVHIGHQESYLLISVTQCIERKKSLIRKKTSFITTPQYSSKVFFLLLDSKYIFQRIQKGG